ncbi:hypothetical protein SEMRO_1044_G234930.1 [Seminavis robusta]|uniref:Uncharacterized protein n=1 Tax=Seminavis robusta TaxID=568900 RepID=A0A9N8EEQ4_9STRA|nr:hypothetical protein SEMRO_1044_G234930.1 [Seminavis robusta]|eukprot:Sro1044_g234930.1 n/a (280) ;mRNA; r:26359-27198
MINGTAFSRRQQDNATAETPGSDRSIVEESPQRLLATATLESPLIAVAEYACNDSTRQLLQETIQLDLPGDWHPLLDPSLLNDESNYSSSASHALALAAVATYNGLLFSLCDWPHFRVMLSTTVSLVNRSREESSFFVSTGANTTTAVEFQMTAECHDCDIDLPLFSDPSATMMGRIDTVPLGQHEPNASMTLPTSPVASRQGDDRRSGVCVMIDVVVFVCAQCPRHHQQQIISPSLPQRKSFLRHWSQHLLPYYSQSRIVQRKCPAALKLGHSHLMFS